MYHLFLTEDAIRIERTYLTEDQAIEKAEVASYIMVQPVAVYYSPEDVRFEDDSTYIVATVTSDD